MNFNMTRPCDNCPFRREGGIRLHPERAREIAKATCLATGSSFPCHKTVDYDNCDDEGDARPTGEESYCAGAIAFALNTKMENQLLRIARRLGMWEARDIRDRDKVFTSISEMISAQLPARKR